MHNLANFVGRIESTTQNANWSEKEKKTKHVVRTPSNGGESLA